MRLLAKALDVARRANVLVGADSVRVDAMTYDTPQGTSATVGDIISNRCDAGLGDDHLHGAASSGDAGLQRAACSELRRRTGHAGVKVIYMRGVLRVEEDAVKTLPLFTCLVNGVVLAVRGYFSSMRRHVSLPEVSWVLKAAVIKAERKWNERGGGGAETDSGGGGRL